MTDRIPIPPDAMRVSAEYSRAHLQYLAGRPTWTQIPRFQRRAMEPAEVFQVDCKGFAMNTAGLLFRDMEFRFGDASENALRRAVRIGFFDCDPHDQKPEDHVSCMAWSGSDWHLVADTMDTDPLGLRRVQDVSQRLTGWVDLTDLTVMHVAETSGA